MFVLAGRRIAATWNLSNAQTQTAIVHDGKDSRETDNEIMGKRNDSILKEDKGWEQVK